MDFCAPLLIYFKGDQNYRRSDEPHCPLSKLLNTCDKMITKLRRYANNQDWHCGGVSAVPQHIMDFFFIKRHPGGHFDLERFTRDDFDTNIDQITIVKR